MPASGTHPARVALFPRPAWAALREDEVVDFSTWSVLRQHSVDLHRGRGVVAVEDAHEVIRSWRPQLDQRSVRRILQRGADKGYWTRGDVAGTPHLWLISLPRLLVRFDLDTAGLPHVVATDSMTRPAEMAARMYATARQLPNHAGQFQGGLISRETIEVLTGLSPRTQQRYDAYGATALIQECHALVEGHEGPGLVGHGYYVDSGGQQWKRLPDLRSPTGHARGSKSAARHASHEATRLRGRYSGGTEGSASDSSAGGNGLPSHPEYPSHRTYVHAASEDSAREQLRKRCTYCASRRAGHCPHITDAVLSFGPAGAIRFVIPRTGR